MPVVTCFVLLDSCITEQKENINIRGRFWRCESNHWMQLRDTVKPPWEITALSSQIIIK